MNYFGILAACSYISDILKLVLRFLKRPIAVFVVTLVLVASVPFGISLAWKVATHSLSEQG